LQIEESLVWAQAGTSSTILKDRQLLEGDGFPAERGKPKLVFSYRGGTSHTSVVRR
jgi:hypothetical protein